MLTYWLVGFGCNLGQSPRVNPLTAEPSYTQIGQVELFFFSLAITPQPFENLDITFENLEIIFEKKI